MHGGVAPGGLAGLAAECPDLDGVHGAWGKAVDGYAARVAGKGTREPVACVGFGVGLVHA